MKVILHIGEHKTGTSYLQRSLHANSDVLLAQGTLYPTNNYHPNSHTFLRPLVFPDAPLPRYEIFRFRGNRDKADERASAAFSELLQEISSHKPKAVVLSTEYLFDPLNSNSQRRLGMLLEKLGGQAQVVLYIREPASEYLSRVQQILRHSGSFPFPGPRPCRKIINSYSEVSGVSMTVCGFDSKLMRDGDVLTDFIERFLPEQTKLSVHLNVSSRNRSMSAEAMTICQERRIKKYPGQDNVVIRSHLPFLCALERLDRSVPGFERPRLHKEVRDLVNARSIELLWLRSTHGLVFPETPYSSIGAHTHIDANRFRNVRDICYVDEYRAAELQRLINRRVTGVGRAVTRCRRLVRNIHSAVTSH
jgi:hypothetical protein